MQGGRLKVETRSSRPSPGSAWPGGSSTTGGRCCSPRPAPSARPACGWWPATPRRSRRSAGSAPRPTTLDADRPAGAARTNTRCGCTASCATSTSSPGSAGGWPTRSATGRSCRRSPTPASSTRPTRPRWSRRSARASNESLAYERGRTDMSTSADRPGDVHHREGETCPVCGDTVRAVEYRAYTVDYCPTCQTGGKVLADNTTSQVPQVAALDEAELCDRVALLDQLGHGRVDARPGERRRCRGPARSRTGRRRSCTGS